MAKVSSVTKNQRRVKMANAARAKRAELKACIMNKETDMQERMEAVLKLSELPRNSARTRVRNRCAITGRPRAYYRKFNMSRVSLRQLGSQGLIPGLVKASW